MTANDFRTGPSQAPSLQARFEAVYRENHWGDDESASGEGSRLDSLCVKETEDALDHAIARFGVASIVDAPCGDFNWMRRFTERHPEIAYRGLDIVADLVARNRAAYPGRTFDVLNLAEAVPPAADLVLCKDLVNHLNDRDVCRVLHNIKASGCRFLLLSNNRGAENVELPFDIGGSSRHLDVMRPPFDFPAPVWETHYLGLWRVDQIPDRLVLPERRCDLPGAAGRRPADDVTGGAKLMDATLPLQVFCAKGTEGIVVFGPYVRAKAGRYRASFRIHCVPAVPPRAAAAACARVEVTTGAGATVVTSRSVSPAELRADPRVILEFEIAAEEVLEFRVSSSGRFDMIVDHERPLVRLEEVFLSAS